VVLVFRCTGNQFRGCLIPASSKAGQGSNDRHGTPGKAFALTACAAERAGRLIQVITRRTPWPATAEPVNDPVMVQTY